jgi:hypothetical protein
LRQPGLAIAAVSAPPKRNPPSGFLRAAGLVMTCKPRCFRGGLHGQDMVNERTRLFHDADATADYQNQIRLIAALLIRDCEIVLP